ncbi:uncharacterized protein LOC114871751 [Osmia bicornis bicornis]|uniref:uncharacterized protein LOC114871751 n=1 Tax=Osmia bicornis bicornis TaxID=1437191 RepID=UPI0010F6EBE7|nr:uncharacterized protein LOC114871751 [Osmia bicornis bicornis]XP_029033892.1 uncharacterized protein LOC114871751 [Osmia bicornis bicornis]
MAASIQASSNNTSSKEQNDKRCLTPIFHINSTESLIRNQKFIKDLEFAKARLRTYAAYTPTDQELQQRAADYRKYCQKSIPKFSTS